MTKRIEEMSPERTAHLIALCDGSRTISEVAKIMGVSRNVVAGRSSRLRAKGHVLRFSGALPSFLNRPVYMPELRLPSSSECCWIFDREIGAEVEFCGLPVGKRHDGQPSSYCPEHHALCYRGVKPEKTWSGPDARW